MYEVYLKQLMQKKTMKGILNKKIQRGEASVILH